VDTVAALPPEGCWIVVAVFLGLIVLAGRSGSS
jgi:hypothetical protein